jgi:hypothetical protein
MLYRAIAAVGLTACLSVPAHAQTAAQGPAGAPLPSAEGTVDEPWSLSLGVNGSYEGNALFTGPQDGEQQFSHSLAAGLNRTWKLRRGGAAFGVSGSQPFYQDTTSLNDFRYNLSGTLAYLVTRRLTWVGGGSLSSGLARDSEVLTDSGLVLPSVTTKTSSAASAFSYMLTPKSTLSWSLAESGVGFDSILFRGGTTLSSALSYSRTVGASQTVGVVQDYSRTFGDDDPSANVYGFLGTWSMSAGHGWTTFASAGVRPYTVPEEDGYRMSFALNAGITRPLRPGQVVGVTYSKSIEQAFGLSTTNNLVQNLSGNYSITFRNNLSATFGGTLTFAQDPLNPDRQIKGQVASAGLSYRLMRNLAFSAGTSFYSRVDDVEQGRVNSTTTFMSLSYVTTWR